MTRTTKVKTPEGTFVLPALPKGSVYAWKYLRTTSRGYGTDRTDANGHPILTSDYDSSEWEIGVWRTLPTDDGYEIRCCSHGFHSSQTLAAASSYVEGEWFALVECRGERHNQSDKMATREMRIVAAWPAHTRPGDKEETLHESYFIGARQLPSEYVNSQKADDAYSDAIAKADAAYMTGTRGIKAAYKQGTEPNNTAYDTAVSAAYKARDDAINAAYDAYDKALQAASDAREAANAPLDAVRAMMLVPHQEKRDAAYERASEAKSMAIQDAVLKAFEAEIPLRTDYTTGVLALLGAPAMQAAPESSQTPSESTATDAGDSTSV